MKTIYLKDCKLVLDAQNKFTYYKSTSFKEIWLFNCPEGCQHYLAKRHIKISQISAIVITEMNTDSMSGLGGILSSLSLISRRNALHLYGPACLGKYLELTKKYSQTNFKYNLYFHVLKTGCVIKSGNCQIFCIERLKIKSEFELLLNTEEKNGRFQLNRARSLRIQAGPFYGRLKKGLKFISPDGLGIDGKRFVARNQCGKKVSFIINKYIARHHVETFY